MAALEPIHDAIRDRFGALRWLGLADSPAYVGEPPCNGCAERF